MKTDMQTKTVKQIEATLGRPIYENPANIYYITNETGRYLLELARLSVECTWLSVKYCALGLEKKLKA